MRGGEGGSGSPAAVLVTAEGNEDGLRSLLGFDVPSETSEGGRVGVGQEAPPQVILHSWNSWWEHNNLDSQQLFIWKQTGTFSAHFH